MGKALANTEGGAVQMMLSLEQAGALDETSLTLTDPDMKQERWEALGRLLGSLDRSTRWWIGDWILFGEAVYGEAASQGADDQHSRYDLANRTTGLDPDTLRNIASICSRIPKERRRPEVGFWTHAEVAALEPGEQVEWLQRAIDNGWGRTQLRAAIREERNPPPDPGGGGGGGGEHMTIGERIEQAARRVFHQAERTADGSAIVPAEAWAQFTAALGEE